MDSVLPAPQPLRNLLPFVPQEAVRLEQQQRFLVRPGLLIHLGSQVVVPSLAALLSRTQCVLASQSKALGNGSPVLESPLADDSTQGGVLLG